MITESHLKEIEESADYLASLAKDPQVFGYKTDSKSLNALASIIQELLSAIREEREAREYAEDYLHDVLTLIPRISEYSINLEEILLWVFSSKDALKLTNWIKPAESEKWSSFKQFMEANETIP